MRVFLLTFFVGFALAAPQGYNYQIQLGPGENAELTLEQLQLLQQYASEQQQQPQIVAIQDNALDLPASSQTVATTSVASGYQFANQLAQQGQQLVQYEQEKQQSQQATASIAIPEIATTVQAPAAEEVHVAVQTEPLTPASFQTSEQVVQQQSQQKSRIEAAPRALPQVQYTQPQITVEPHYQQQQQQPAQELTSHAQYHQHHQAAAAPQQQSQYNKEFYYLSAPQEDYDQSQDLQKEINQLKKNLRVVFIKAPEQNGVSDAALKLAQHASGGQTAIYVLTKQHDIADLSKKLQQTRTQSQAKPEVVFIKYKTPEEAEHAQRTIQAQYEALDGPNHFIHEGVVPSHNFVGSTGVDPRKSAASGSGVAPAAQYLPAAAKH